MRRHGGELIMGTTVECLPRAVRFVTWRIDEPVSSVIANSKSMQSLLGVYYHLPGKSLPNCRALGLLGDLKPRAAAMIKERSSSPNSDHVADGAGIQIE